MFNMTMVSFGNVQQNPDMQEENLYSDTLEATKPTMSLWLQTVMKK